MLMKNNEYKNDKSLSSRIKTELNFTGISRLDESSHHFSYMESRQFHCSNDTWIKTVTLHKEDLMLEC